MTAQTTTLLTADELRDALCGACPRSTDNEAHQVEYTAQEHQDDSAWQDAECSCGIAWREVSTVTFITQIDASGDEIGEGAKVDR